MISEYRRDGNGCPFANVESANEPVLPHTARNVPAMFQAQRIEPPRFNVFGGIEHASLRLIC